MDVLLVGAGGREHALAGALRRDPQVGALHAVPGNPGIADLATLHRLDPVDPDAVAGLAGRLGVGLVVIGPEAPLVSGVADAVRGAGIPCFGPTAAAARLEASKAFAKEVMAAAGVPTARSRVTGTPAELDAALELFGPPYVVKDDALAAGKGVVVTADRELARAHGVDCARVVVEEYLDGPEVSLFVVTDGSAVRPLLPAQDFKRVGDGDRGPNTGGMGAYAPLPWLPAGTVEEVLAAVVEPTLREMRERGTPFAGLLYVGLALTSAGPRVVEFNARFGDPETQAVLALLDTPLAGLLLAAATGRLAGEPELRWADGAAVTVVLAASGYPRLVRTGDPVTGLADAAGPGVSVHQAGTSAGERGLMSSGGRVLSVTAVGADLTAARDAAYRALDRIDLPGGQARRDIAAAAAEGSTTT